MPAVSAKQQRFMGAELGRKRAGKKTRTEMSEKQLEEFATMGKRMKKGNVKSKMPKGAGLSPSGDIGAKRQEESVKVGGFKSGPTVTASSRL